MTAAVPVRGAIGAVLRTVAGAAVLVLVYFLAPLDRGWGTGTAVAFGACLVGVGAVVGAQAWTIARSPYPMLRAATVLALSFPTLILLFASAYVLLSHDRPGSFSQSLTRVQSLYFTVTVFSTVGFGDIVARAPEAQLAVVAQMIVDLLYLGLLVRSITVAARIGVRRKAAGDG